MNAKTTLTLAFTLVLLIAAYVVVQSRSAQTQATPSKAADAPGASATRDLLSPKLGDVVKVVYQRHGADEWVFAKDPTAASGQSNWTMTTPLTMPCVSWEVEKYGRLLGNLQYDIGYRLNEEGAPRLADAGLDPPQASVTLTDATGRSAAIEIGKPAPGRGTYVRLKGGESFVIGKSDLKELLKTRALDFRERQLWTFENNHVTRIEVEDRAAAEGPVNYAFVRDGARWMMQSPVSARATSKLDEMLTALNRLRVAQWSDDDPGRLKVYGLDPAPWTIRVTVEEVIAEKKEPEASAEPAESEPAEEPKPARPPEKKTSIYELHFSDVSPIGKDNESYVRSGTENAVGTVMKSTLEKFKPAVNQWRDMRVSFANVNDATRIEIKTGGGEATLNRKDGHWDFAPEGGRAETSAVAELLKAIAGLTAVAFTNDEAMDPAALGFASPQAEIRLTVPGAEGVERIVVGNYTDETSRRLVYVRRNEVASIAKVKAADVTLLMQSPEAYRDRTIVDLVPARFDRLVLSRENRFVGGRDESTFARRGAVWLMVGPVEAAIRSEPFGKLLDALGALRGESIVGDASTESAYGLTDPDATATIHYLAVGEADQPPDATPATQKPTQSLTLAVNEHEGKCYARRKDGNTVYEIKKDVCQQLLAEYRSDRVLTFDENRVTAFSVRHGSTTLAVEKKGEKWEYPPEPDLPLDAKKVVNALVQIRDLRTPRYVRNAAADLTSFGLGSPEREVTLTLDDGTTLTLLAADKLVDGGGERGHFAVVKGTNDVFLLPADAVQRLNVTLETVEQGK